LCNQDNHDEHHISFTERKAARKLKQSVPRGQNAPLIFGQGFAPDSTGGAYDFSPDPLDSRKKE